MFGYSEFSRNDSQDHGLPQNVINDMVFSLFFKNFNRKNIPVVEVIDKHIESIPKQWVINNGYLELFLYLVEKQKGKLSSKSKSQLKDCMSEFYLYKACLEGHYDTVKKLYLIGVEILPNSDDTDHDPESISFLRKNLKKQVISSGHKNIEKFLDLIEFR